MKGIHPDATLVDHIRALRKERTLHQAVANRLATLLVRLYPDSVAIAEVSGVLGGRNDLMHFEFSSRKAVFEVFASASQVPQDLRLLELSATKVRIAILIDREVDIAVSRQYFRKKPDSFPYLWISQVLREDLEDLTLARLREITDESSSVAMLRRLLATPNGASIDAAVRRTLAPIELASKAERPKKLLTGRELLSLMIVGRISKALGVPSERLRALHEWLRSGAIDFGVQLASAGFSAFLLTDLHDYRALWSAGDVADAVLLGGGKPVPYVLLDVTDLIRLYFALNKVVLPAQAFHLFHTYEEYLPLLKEHFVSWKKAPGLKSNKPPGSKAKKASGS